MRTSIKPCRQTIKPFALAAALFLEFSALAFGQAAVAQSADDLSELLSVRGYRATGDALAGTHTRLLCRNLTSVTGIAVSPKVIRMRSLVCGDPTGTRFESFGDDLHTDPVKADGSRNVLSSGANGDPVVLMNVHLADPSDNTKMVPGQSATISGDFSLVMAGNMRFLIADDAKYLHGDPFAR